MALLTETYNRDEDFTLLGHTFHGIKDLEDYVEMSVDEIPPFFISDLDKVTPKKTGDVHVGELWHPYPTFDDDDAENRYFRNFIVRNRPITEADMKRLHDLPCRDNYKRISEAVPEDMFPIVYYDDEHNVIVAREHQRLSH